MSKGNSRGPIGRGSDSLMDIPALSKAYQLFSAHTHIIVTIMKE